jgi:hypothetical protein
MRATKRARRWSMERILREVLFGRPGDAASGDADVSAYEKALVESLVYRAAHGNVSAFKLIWNIVDGPAPARMNVSGACSRVRIVACDPPARKAELGGRPAARRRRERREARVD